MRSERLKRQEWHISSACSRYAFHFFLLTFHVLVMNRIGMGKNEMEGGALLFSRVRPDTTAMQSYDFSSRFFFLFRYTP